ncbi:MAG: cyclopropane-fatty-acyl-phospholipid synthase, partial [Candidatus Methanoperedens sp.]|nr:cyclopropane-fatty-acyl-phospholipid synthase [Candidatus Methanoperedens sp.]
TQHDEVPPEFFQLVLGRHLKYSACYWPDGVTKLDGAEEAMLQLTCERAGVQDGMTILDVGCGWGSLSLWIAQHYPNCQVQAVSNSRTQQAFIQQRAYERRLTNITAHVADIVEFDTDQRFDRVLSIEMFEHMKNYEQLMGKIAHWLKPQGRLFVHHFSHRENAYEFDHTDPNNWMARYFFTGGTMPSDDLLLYFQRDLTVVNHWRVVGTHYERTLNAWLTRLDDQRDRVKTIMADVYGANQALRWFVYWRLFFMGCAEVFGIRRGQAYFVTHLLFEKCT